MTSRKPRTYGDAIPPAIHNALAGRTSTGVRTRWATSVLEPWSSAWTRDGSAYSVTSEVTARTAA
jgi:hypothetical protein